MTATQVDLANWPRREQFQFFRGFDRPHYAITTRLDVSRLMLLRKSQGLSPFRTCIHAIGVGIHAVPELRMRFRGDTVTEYDRVQLSSTIPLDSGDFRYAYFDFDPNRAAFDRAATTRIEEVKRQTSLNANDGTTDDVAYLSCLPWLDYSSLDNALPHADDCIPRVSWGKIVPKADGYDMAMTIQVHHALVDGRQVGEFFEATASALNMGD